MIPRPLFFVFLSISALHLPGAAGTTTCDPASPSPDPSFGVCPAFRRFTGYVNDYTVAWGIEANATGMGVFFFFFFFFNILGS
jgi:hypothetical protein